MKKILYYMLLLFSIIAVASIATMTACTLIEFKKYEASSVEELKKLNIHGWTDDFDIPSQASDIKFQYYIDNPHSTTMQYLDHNCKINVSSGFSPIKKEQITFSGKSKNRVKRATKKYRCLKSGDDTCLYFKNQDKKIISIIDSSECPFKVIEFYY